MSTVTGYSGCYLFRFDERHLCSLRDVIMTITPNKIIEFTIAVVSAFTIKPEGNDDIKDIINLNIIKSTTPNPILISQSFINMLLSLN